MIILLQRYIIFKLSSLIRIKISLYQIIYKKIYKYGNIFFILKIIFLDLFLVGT